MSIGAENRAKRPVRAAIGRFPLGQSHLRSLAEAFVIAALLSLGSVVSTVQATEQMYLQALVIGPLCAIYYAARSRLEPTGIFANQHIELVRGISLTAIVTLLTATVVLPGITAITISSHVFFTLFLAVWNMGAFAFFRALAYLWPIWVNLRRSRLRWEMTHSIMLVVAPFSLLLVVLFMLLIFVASGVNLFQTAGPDAGVPGLTLFQTLMALLPLLGILIFLSVIGLAVLLPPAAIASYFAARKIAARLEALSGGTSALRQGNWAVRVRVDGQDEISTVQRDFNLMAGNLEHTINELRAERDNVERLLRTQQELVASVSHELRTPVATMRGYLDSALNGERLRSTDERQADLQIMSQEIVRLQRLIDDLFILSRTDAGQLPLVVEPTDVTALIGRSVAAVTESAWRTGRVEVIEHISAGLPAALVDAGRLEQVLRNLLSNAIRHTPPGGIVAVSASASEAYVQIDVQDTGHGIASEDLERVFQRFTRLDDARQRDPAGAGLGLALVKELTEAMGGQVTVESEPGSGSRFTLNLPAVTD